RCSPQPRVANQAPRACQLRTMLGSSPRPPGRPRRESNPRHRPIAEAGKDSRLVIKARGGAYQSSGELEVSAQSSSYSETSRQDEIAQRRSWAPGQSEGVGTAISRSLARSASVTIAAVAPTEKRG